FLQFVNASAGSLTMQMLILASVLNGIGLVVNGAVIFLGSTIRSRLQSASRFPKLPQYVLATVFTGLACRLALQPKLNIE
ncbi:LysE family translocator, partial [Rhizobium ruizarguesonis]